MAKVLVYSRMREVSAKTVVTYNPDGSENARCRHFSPLSATSEMGQCYMSPEEAEFLVESEENIASFAAGKPKYRYPANMPIPVANDHDGALLPPADLNGMGSSDPRQAQAAEKVMAQRAAGMKAAKARIAADNTHLPTQAEAEAAGAVTEPSRNKGRNSSKNTEG